ncbi:hypothetical protein [Caulobacter sp. X]|uniref:hypothetical protein n=1 Tax=Caulobacter sp. X TaxID=2048901 RepID=UPI000C14B85A|nr:hypothetical protein [Caulobacter sp. X]PIB96087.1 hypothetical protein CSW60_16185 [Caulobacter sp. X]
MTDQTPAATGGQDTPTKSYTRDVYTGVTAAQLVGMKQRRLAEGAIEVKIEPDGQGTFTVTATYPA